MHVEEGKVNFIPQYFFLIYPKDYASGDARLIKPGTLQMMMHRLPFLSTSNSIIYIEGNLNDFTLTRTSFPLSITSHCLEAIFSNQRITFIFLTVVSVTRSNQETALSPAHGIQMIPAT